MSDFKAFFARVTKIEDDKYSFSLGPDEMNKFERKGLAVSRFDDYLKSMTEALIEQSITELNKIEIYMDKKLFHITKGLLSTLSFMSDPKRCESWAEHSYKNKDVTLLEQHLINAFDFTSEIEIKNSPFRKRLTPAKYVIEGDDVFTYIEGELENHSCAGVLAFPMSDDVRQRFVYVIRLLSDIIDALKPNKSFSNEDIDYYNGQTDLGIHEEWMFRIRSVGNALSYIVNCTSWRDNELHSFDLFEMEVKTGYRHLSVKTS